MSDHYALILASLKIDLDEIQRLITSTPPGDKRTALCDAQIHVIASIQTLKKAA